MLSEIVSVMKNIDTQWQQRKRKVDTLSIFSLLSEGSIRRRGFSHILQERENVFSDQALAQARKKLPRHCFREANKEIQRGSKGPRVFAIDGSKVHVHPSYKKYGYKSRTNDKPVARPAIRPIGMLSSMLNVHTKACHDAVLTTHFDERKAAEEL
ncbi:unnamed protein product, partial [Chrysoparadoxa australica]